ENQLVNLGTDIEDSPVIVGMIKKYKEQVGVPVNAPATGTAAMGTAAMGTATGTGTGYLGLNGCRACHEAAYGFWRTTRHSHAWEALIPDNQYRDPSCVVCHVTGGTASNPDVQCEACHGPGAAHAAKPDAKGIVIRDPSEATCTGCHHAPQAKEWDYTIFRKAILGPG